ncbi:hypothetical protein [Collimonas sp. OK412]|jgi:hypothetical protein|uniref:hypothetical protein n=1 Tax=Collimonas sp. (strain OK412) TaxID=1801619 RepID=UPI0008E89182|nr:hypothetical protein [Collimonas sp. OK412]SFD28179.1 hypothetical protein SAMN04515619_1368 [Collimonas sp. OK412]
MTAPNVSFEQLQRVHSALRITIPLHEVSPLMLSTLSVIAHCWRDRIPAHLWRDPVNEVRSSMTTQEFQRQYLCTFAATSDNKQQPIDLKRRAAADYE